MSQARVICITSGVFVKDTKFACEVLSTQIISLSKTKVWDKGLMSDCLKQNVVRILLSTHGCTTISVVIQPSVALV